MMDYLFLEKAGQINSACLLALDVHFDQNSRAQLDSGFIAVNLDIGDIKRVPAAGEVRIFGTFGTWVRRELLFLAK